MQPPIESVAREPSTYPDWLDDVWAKSAELGEGGRPETLAQHMECAVTVGGVYPVTSRLAAAA